MFDAKQFCCGVYIVPCWDEVVTLLNPAKLSLWYFTVSIELWTNLRGINTSIINLVSICFFFIGLVTESLNNKTDLLTIYHFFFIYMPIMFRVTSMSLVVSSYCLFTVNIIRRVLHCLLICFLHWWVTGWSWRTTWNIRGTWSFSGAIFCFLQGIHKYRII
jgi:hypothetical protein